MRAQAASVVLLIAFGGACIEVPPLPELPPDADGFVDEASDSLGHLDADAEATTVDVEAGDGSPDGGVDVEVALPDADIQADSDVLFGR